MLGWCGSGTARRTRVSSMAARSSSPVTGLPFPGGEGSNAPRWVSRRALSYRKKVRRAPTARARALARVSLLDVLAQPDRGAIAAPADSVVFSPLGQILATGSDDGTARMWDVATRQQIGVPMTIASAAVI